MARNNNDKVIDRSIERLRKSQYDTILYGYTNFMKGALEHLIEVHDSSDHHVNEDSTLACGIFYNGSVVMIWGHRGFEQVRWRKAPVRLLEIASTLPQKGWVGVLLSGMKGWYNVEKEMGHLHDTISWSKGNFAKYFKPYTVR